MGLIMHRNQSVSAHSFAMVPRADIPRSAYKLNPDVVSHKTTFDAGKLIPIYVDEVLPGDTFSLSCTAFGRMATPIFPDRKSTRLNSSHRSLSRMPSSA